MDTDSTGDSEEGIVITPEGAEVKDKNIRPPIFCDTVESKSLQTFIFKLSNSAFCPPAAYGRNILLVMYETQGHVF